MLKFALPPVGKLALDKDADIRDFALSLLMDHYPEKGVLESLCRALKHEDAEVRRSTLSLMTTDYDYKVDDTLIRMVLPLLRDKVEDVRLAAVKGLGKNAKNPEAYDLLKMEVRDEATKLVELILNGSKDVSGLVTALKDPSPKVRTRAIEVLAPLILFNTQIAQAMREACKDSDPDVRKAALKALGKEE